MGQNDKAPDVSRSRNSIRESIEGGRAREILEKSVGELTSGEKLVIWRRRHGLSQAQMALTMGVGKNKYCEMEIQGTAQEPVYIGTLDLYELCYILRRRNEHTILYCAREMNISRYWYNLMELGKAPEERLVQYWIEHEG